MKRLASRRSRFAALLAAGFFAGGAIALCSVAHAEHGRFDRTEVNPRDEAYIFTPAGFTGAGKPAVAESPHAARLNVTIVDAGTGKPTPCRVNVVGSDGNFYQPRDNPLSPYSLIGTWPETLAGNRPGKAPIRYFGHFFYTRGTLSVDVPAGPVRIEVWKGFEYRVEMLSTHVAAGAVRDVKVTLTHAVPMAAAGWHSGDPHLHFIRSSDRDDDTIFDLLEAEDIHLGMVLCYNDNTSAYPGLMPELATPQLRGLGQKSLRRRGSYQIISGQEYRNGVLGHLNLFMRDRLVLDGAQLDPNVGPLFAQIAEETRKQGGYAFHAHGGYGLEIWADLVQGATTGVELLQFGIYRGIGLEGWYHVLNAGFRFPAIAACDYPACRKLGDCRTYAHVDGEPSFEGWLKAAAEGRSFITSGPLLFLEVDGRRPGDTIHVAGAAPTKLRAKLRVRSETTPVTNVQLIVGGRVQRELTVPREAASAEWLELDETVELGQSSWIAARAFSGGPGGAADAESHTNPVYVYREGKPPRSAEAIEYLVARLDEQISDHDARDVPQKQAAIDYFRRSREILLNLKAEATTSASPSRELAEKVNLHEALAKPLLPSETPLGELRAFVEPRIASLPAIANRHDWEQFAANTRRDFLDNVVFRGAAREWRDAKTRVEWLDTSAGGPGYTIRKLRYEALPGMWIPAILYLPDRLAGRVPLAIDLNGHVREGKAADYKQLLSINLAKRGMLVLDLEWFGMGQLATPGFSHYSLNQLDLCGASGLAPFYLALARALDLGLELEHADPARVVVSGLSGGGWQTILIAGLDARVTLANPVAGYGSFRTNIMVDDLGDSEQAPSDMAAIADYTHLTALRAPRPTLLTYNASDDCCFKSGNTLEPLLQAARPAFALYGAEDRLRSHVNHIPGTHNFEEENRGACYAMIGDFFYPGDCAFPRAEIQSRAELKTAAQLEVPLAEGNVDFHRLAASLLDRTVGSLELPTDRSAAERWQHERRAKLAALLKVPKYRATESAVAKSELGAYEVAGYCLVCAEAATGEAAARPGWTVPCVEIRATASHPEKIAIVIADDGKASAVAEVERLLAAGYRVLAADLLGWGESKVTAQDPHYLFPLFLAAVGERPLAIQAAQLAAIARWAGAAWPDEPIRVVTTGPRASMAALVAAALEPETIDAVEVSSALGSLKQLVAEGKTVEEFPELFAFGLLSEFDVSHIVALVAPRHVTFCDANDRARRELAPIKAWYAIFGADFDPVSGKRY